MVGEEVGAICAAEHVSSPEHLQELLSVDGHPLRRLLAMVLHTRFHRNRRYNWRDVMKHLESPWHTLPQWMQQLLTRTYAMYRTIRQAAAPRHRQPPLRTRANVLVPRQVRRDLKPAGVHVNVESNKTIKRRANERWTKLWASMEGVSVVMWFDNFYKPKYMANPNRENSSLNATVMAVLHTTALPLFPGLPPLAELVRRSRVAADAVCALHASLVDTVHTIQHLHLTRDRFRLPLDVVRYDVKSLQWTPFLVTDDQVGTQAQLCTTLRTCRDVLQTGNVRRPMPLLVDENIAYRVWKMAYCRLTTQWDVHAFTKDLPLLYGVWHPYKHVLELVYRRFLPLFAYLQKGRMAPGDRYPPRTSSGGEGGSANHTFPHCIIAHFSQCSAHLCVLQ